MRRKALIVDDDPTINAMIADILTLDRFEVTRVHDGDEALGALRSDRYDVVLLDVMLPGQNGLEILKEIRAAADLSTTPVVMLTAKADDDSAWAGWRAGCDYYMTKPFDPSELIAILHRLVPTPSGTKG
jgi:two-component system response regulator CpxR